MSSWDFKEKVTTWEQFVAAMEPRKAEADAFFTKGINEYYAAHDPMKPPAMFAVFDEADRLYSPVENYEKIIEAFDVYLTLIHEEIKKLFKPVNEAQVKFIHVKKGEYKVSEEKYREILKDVSGKGSSKELVWWEAKNVIHRMKMGATTNEHK